MSALILGAGLAGIGAAIELQRVGQSYQLLEGADRPGGLATTDVISGFSFDQTGHFLHFKNRRTADYFHESTGPLERIERKAAVVVRGRIAPYPIQYNLWAIDPALRKRALHDLKVAQLEMRSGSKSLADAIIGTWGETITEIFMRPYNEKLWGRTLEELPSDCCGRYQLAFNIELAVAGCDGPVDYTGYNASFSYPKSGRIGDVSRALTDRVATNICYGSRVTDIDLRSRLCTTVLGKAYRFNELISTIPLPHLLRFLRAPFSIDEIFDYTQIAAVRIGIRGSMRCPYHWIYTPDRELPFYRIGFPQNVNRLTCPEGCASLLVEYAVPAHGPRAATTDIARSALQYCVSLNLIEIEKSLLVTEKVISPAYVVYRAQGREKFREMIDWLELQGVHLAGRFGMWDYFSMEEAFESGKAAGRRVTSQLGCPTAWGDQ